MKITGNEPVHPTMEHGYDKYGIASVQTTLGMTIRQQFAMAAMTGILSNPNTTQGLQDAETMARWCTENADALIAELNRTEADHV